MKIIQYPSPNTWKELIRRPENEKVSLQETVQKVFTEVGNSGDEALKKYTLQFDKVDLSDLKVSDNELAEAEQLISDELKQAIIQAKK